MVPLFRVFFVSVSNEDRKNGAMNVVDFSIFSSFENMESHQSDIRGRLTRLSIWSGAGVLVWILISLFPITHIIMVSLNKNIVSLIFFLVMLLSPWDVMVWTLLHFPVICWPYISSKTCWTVILLFFSNIDDPNSSPMYFCEVMISWGIFFWIVDIWHVMMFTVL